MSTLDQSLLSLEKLDRSSPELWPESRVSEYMYLNSAAQNNLPQPWNRPLDDEDKQLLRYYGTLSVTNLIAEVKHLHDIAYKLGLEEAKEMTRGKYLNILEKRRKKPL
ncbi:protein lin-52 homolog isoform X2 [Macrosteles quadrilineatus]|uniref:protein lin-52 homolog isoform X2 n=1 Tax=Macrosteles quadrilineatus TaxID=74068 RepID=UPI0023E1E775|nr:protein lin-52 homolog isoform X2 [Macrosteles quadrilineatus]